jgi:hypothetical protein
MSEISLQSEGPEVFGCFSHGETVEVDINTVLSAQGISQTFLRLIRANNEADIS